MKINLFDVIFCILMRYKSIIFSYIAFVILMFLVDLKCILIVPICITILLGNIVYNGNVLFNFIFLKPGYFKKKMYNKYKDIIDFKCVLIYDEKNLEYHYIKYEDVEYYMSNIYLFVIKTYEKKVLLEYEKMRSKNLIFIGSSKSEVAENFHEYIEVKVRSMNSDIMKMDAITKRHSDIAREVEFDKYSN